jgi:hypothetical protein
MSDGEELLKIWAAGGLFATSPRSPDSYRDRCGLFATIPAAGVVL